jgi:hypothetical protein
MFPPPVTEVRWVKDAVWFPKSSSSSSEVPAPAVMPETLVAPECRAPAARAKTPARAVIVTPAVVPPVFEVSRVALPSTCRSAAPMIVRDRASFVAPVAVTVTTTFCAPWGMLEVPT